MNTNWYCIAACLFGTIGLLIVASAQSRPTTRPASQPAAPISMEAMLRQQFPVPDNAEVMKDIEFARFGGKPVLLDLYVPKDAAGPLPLIIWVHGGGWREQSKDLCIAAPMAAKGYVVASINYRLSQEAVFPAQIEDCKAAVRFLRANAAKYKIDPKRFGVWGASAGGHLVALLGTTGDNKEFEGSGGNPGVSTRVQAVCDYFGPADFTDDQWPMLKLADSPVAKMLGGTPAQVPDAARKASPITHVAKDNPPFFILHGDDDKLVPLRQSQVFYEALKKVGVDATFKAVPRAGHGFKQEGVALADEVRAFFDKHLKTGLKQ